MSKYGSEKSQPPKIDNNLISKTFSSAFPFSLQSPPHPPLSPESQVISDLDQDFQNNSSNSFENKFSTPPRQQETPQELLRICDGSDQAIFPEELASSSWSCSKCTYLNPETYLICEICKETRDSVDDKEDGLIEEKEVCPLAPPLPLVESLIPSNQLHNPYFYSLVAVVRHVGRSAFSGHYTCDVMAHQKSQETNSIGTDERHWYRCDDSRVSEISQVAPSPCPS
jgi:hypothetical protein